MGQISNWTVFHIELTFLQGILQKNGYLEKIIDKFFKIFLNNIHLVIENLQTVERKAFAPSLFYLGIISLQARTKLQQAMKGVLNCCKLEIVFKCQTRLSNSFRYKEPIPKVIVFGVAYKIQCGLSNKSYYGEGIRHLGIASREHIGGLRLTGKKLKPSNNNSICDNLIYCNFLPFFPTLVFYLMKTRSICWKLKEAW